MAEIPDEYEPCEKLATKGRKNNVRSRTRLLEKRSAKYNGRYYANERFSQWRNCDPLLSDEEMAAIRRPIDFRSKDPTLVRYHNCNVLLLTRDDIVDLIKKAKDEKGKRLIPLSRAERWIQIKWRLCNFPDYSVSFPSTVTDDVPKVIVLRPRDKRDWDPSWPWRPELPDDLLILHLKMFGSTVRRSFDECKDSAKFFPEMAPYGRKSFLNWDWVMMRGLHMLCKTCGETEDEEPSCLVKRYGWALKKLSTKKNKRTHIAWWHFLIYYITNTTLYDKSPIPNFEWKLKAADVELKEFPKVSTAITSTQLPITKNPALLPSPLSSSARKSPRLSHRVGRSACSSGSSKKIRTRH